MRVMRMICAVLCFGIGGAFAVSTIDTLMHPTIFSEPAWLAGSLAAMFLLGSFLLLRRSPK